MKKIASLILIILLISIVFNVKAFAVTLPNLAITSNHYSARYKKELEDTHVLTVGNTLQLYSILEYGNDLWDPENPDSIGIFVLQTDLEGVSWTSSNENVATIDNTGKVTGVSAGETTITAKYNDETDEYKITVYQQNKKVNYNLQVSYMDYKVASEPSNDEAKKPIPAILPIYYHFNVNDIIQLYAGLIPDDESIPAEEISSVEIQWVSSDTDIATIDNNGVLTILKEGSVDITASCVFEETAYRVTHRIDVESTSVDSPIKPETPEEKGAVVNSPVNKDITTVNKELPKTGKNIRKIILGISIVTVLSIIMFKKSRDIK